MIKIKKTYLNRLEGIMSDLHIAGFNMSTILGQKVKQAQNDQIET